MVKINLYDIPSERAYVELKKDYVKYFINEIDKSNLNLDKKTRMKLYNLKIGKSFSLNLLKELSEQLNIPQEIVSKNISNISSSKNTKIGIKNPKFPINFKTEEGIRLISAIMGDGEINANLQIRYNNQDEKLVKEILSCTKKLFGDIDYKIYFRPDGVYQLHFPKITGLIISKLNLKSKAKVHSNNPIPSFIFKTNKRLKSIFIAQFFSDEGNVREKDRRLQVKQSIICPAIKEIARKYPQKYCANILIDLQKLLRDVGIKSIISLSSYRLDKHGQKADWELSSYGKENLENFRKNIGFYLDYKNNLLDKCISNYKFPSAPRNKRLEFAFEKFKIVEKRQSFVTKYLLAKECKRSIKVATYYLIDLQKNKKIKCIEKPRDKKGHPMARKYKSN